MHSHLTATRSLYHCNNALQSLEVELAKVGRLKTFAPQALANSLWAFATLRYFPAQPCFQALISEISLNLPYFKEQARTQF